MRVQPWDTQGGPAQETGHISLRIKTGLVREWYFLGKCLPYVVLLGEIIQRDLEVWSGSFLSIGEAGKGLTRDAEPKEK